MNIYVKLSAALIIAVLVAAVGFLIANWYYGKALVEAILG